MTRHITLLFLLMIALLLSSCSNDPFAKIGEKEVYVIEDFTGSNIMEEKAKIEIKASKDLTNWALAFQSSKGYVVYNKEKGKEHDKVFGIELSPDGKKIVYTAEEGGRWFIVINNEEVKKYDDIYNPVFSRDSHTIAYQAHENEKEFIVNGQKEGKRYLGVGSPVFSPDGSTVAYKAGELNSERKDRGLIKECIVVGEREGKRYSWVSNPVFSPDGSLVAYVATIASKNAEFPAIISEDYWSSIGSLGSLSGNYYIHDGINGKGDWFVVIEGVKEGERYKQVTPNPPVFSPDGNIVAYGAMKLSESEFFPIPLFDIVFEKKEKAYTEEGKEKCNTFIYHIFDIGIVFSPDSSKVAYRASSSVTICKKIKERWDTIYKSKTEGRTGSIVFSPDSQILAYVTEKDGKELVVIGEKEGDRYDSVSAPVFSPDSRKVGYYVVKGNKVLRVVQAIK